MKAARYTPEFKAEAIKQITERGHGVVEVSKRLGVSDKSLYLWLRQSKELTSSNAEDIASLKKELSRIKAELKRTTEERDILKRPLRTLRSCPTKARIHRPSLKQYVPCTQGASQWLLRMEKQAIAI